MDSRQINRLGVETLILVRPEGERQREPRDHVQQFRNRNRTGCGKVIRGWPAREVTALSLDIDSENATFCRRCREYLRRLVAE